MFGKWKFKITFKFFVHGLYNFTEKIDNTEQNITLTKSEFIHGFFLIYIYKDKSNMQYKNAKFMLYFFVEGLYIQLAILMKSP